MQIHYNPNPLLTTIELDPRDVLLLRVRILADQYEEQMVEAHMMLESGQTEQACVKLSQWHSEAFIRQVDHRLNFLIEALQEEHCGDCTCVASSCLKCRAESFLGIDTIEGLSKYEANKINFAFRDGRSPDEAEAWLQSYCPQRTCGWLILPEEDFNRHVPRWRKEAATALAWLRRYRHQHFAAA